MMDKLPGPIRRLIAPLTATPIGRRLAGGTFWALLGAFFTRIVGIASSVIVARVLGREALGEFGIIQNTVDTFQLFAGFGLGLTATKYVAAFRIKDPARAGRVIVLSGFVAAASATVVASVLLLFAPWIAANTLAAPQLAGVLRVGAITLFLGALNGAQTGTLAGFEAFRTRAIVGLGTGLLTPVFVVLGASRGGVHGAVWGIAASAGAAWLINHVAVRYEARRAGVPFTLGFDAEDWAMLWHFSVPALLASLMVTPVDWICATLLVNQPSGYSEMGVFRVTAQWFGVVIFLPRIASLVFLPILSERIGAGDIESSAATFRALVGASSLATLPVVVPLAIASPWIMAMYGKSFVSGWPTLVIALITAGVVSMQGPIGQYIAASGKMWLGLVMNLGWAVVYLGATLILVRFGAIGLATARLGAYLVHTVWTCLWAFGTMRRALPATEPRRER
jgi:O-antigen/teichoic acid export membrane protein